MINIKFKPLFQIRVNNRQILAYYNHWIYSFDLVKRSSPIRSHNGFSAEKIDMVNLKDCEQQTDFFVGRLQKYLTEQEQYVDGFLFKKNGVPCGFIWIMYPIGNEFQYRVRKVDAFLFDVCVMESFRGQSVCGLMLNYVFEYLFREKNVHEVQLAVRKNNTSAIKAYTKAGGKIVCSRRFIQLGRQYNIPYYMV